MTAMLIVRAEVEAPADRAAFDSWYQHEHLPQAAAAFGARRASRGWSDTDPAVHFAFYEFENLVAARAVPGSQALQALVAEFDARWGERAVRTREIIDMSHSIEPG